MRARPLVLAALLASSCAPEGPPAATPPGPPPPVSVPSAVPAAPPGPPVAPVRAAGDTYFGVTVTDPYRWMEQGSPELSQWMKAQSDFTRAALDAIPARAALLERIEELDDSGDRVSSVNRVGSRTFYLRRARGQSVARLCAREGLSGPERVLLDPTARATATTHFSLDDYWPSLDGRLVAYAVSPSGSEVGVLKVLDTATMKDLPDAIDRVGFGGVSWLDGERFLYNRFQELAAGAPASDRFKNITTFVHAMGRDPGRDPAVFGGGAASKIVPLRDDEFPLVLAGGAYAVALAAAQDEAVYVAPRARLSGPATPWKKVADPARDRVTWALPHRDDLFLLTHRDAPHFKVVKTSLAHPDVEHATVVVPESEVIVQAIVDAEDALYVSVLDAGIGRLLRVPYRGGAPERVALPVEGTLRALSADSKTPGATFELSSWAVSPRVYAYDPAAGKVSDTTLLAPSPVDFSGVVAEEVQARSADGTLVPLSIVHQRELARDGSHPTWLKGYGSYGVSELPEFHPTLLAWLEKGGVYAVCHPRGGGEKGEEWHRAGMQLQKQHTIDDMIGCAQALVDQRYTSPGKLAGEGTSAGGVAIGGAINQRPDLFGAALILVGLSNVLRFEQSENVYNATEFGTVKTEEGFRALLGQDAVAHVKDGARYPAVLLTTGVNDPRVAPWMALKMAARLQAATSSGKPVLLRVSYEGGHVEGATRRQEDEELADEYAFLLWQLGAR